MTTLRRSIMTLYSGALDIYSHQVRIVLAEKGVTVDVTNIDDDELPEELLEINPYSSVPTLIDRDLVLYQANVIMEYLDERFPHPPLLPVYPIARAKCRLMMFRIEQDWYSLMRLIEHGKEKAANEARLHLRDSLLNLAPVFAEMPFFLSEEFSLVDCCIAPLLWRLPSYDIELPKSAKSIRAYAKRVFDRQSFQASLSEQELELREHHAYVA